MKTLQIDRKFSMILPPNHTEHRYAEGGVWPSHVHVLFSQWGSEMPGVLTQLNGGPGMVPSWISRWWTYEGGSQKVGKEKKKDAKWSLKQRMSPRAAGKDRRSSFASGALAGKWLDWALKWLRCLHGTSDPAGMSFPISKLSLEYDSLSEARKQR